jgi:hypothetical protein
MAAGGTVSLCETMRERNLIGAHKRIKPRR